MKCRSHTEAHVDEVLSRLIEDFVDERLVTQRVLEALPQDAWDRPSSAEGWTLRDCAAHVGSVDETTSALVSGGGEPRPPRPAKSRRRSTP